MIKLTVELVIEGVVRGNEAFLLTEIAKRNKITLEEVSFLFGEVYDAEFKITNVHEQQNVPSITTDSGDSEIIRHKTITAKIKVI